MPWLYQLHAHGFRSCRGSIEILHLEPQEDAVSVGLKRRIADGSMVMLDIPSVELEDQPMVVINKALVFSTAVRASASEQTLIPAARRFDVINANQWLWPHHFSSLISTA